MRQPDPQRAGRRRRPLGNPVEPGVRAPAERLSAGRNIQLRAGHAGAKIMMETNRVVGIIFIPEDFEGRVGRGEQAVFPGLRQHQRIPELRLRRRSGRRRWKSWTPGTVPTWSYSCRPQPSTRCRRPVDRHRRNAALQPDRRLRQLPDPGRTDRHLFQTLMMVIGMISVRRRYTGSILYYSRHGLGFAGWPASC